MKKIVFTILLASCIVFFTQAQTTLGITFQTSVGLTAGDFKTFGLPNDLVSSDFRFLGQNNQKSYGLRLEKDMGLNFVQIDLQYRTTIMNFGMDLHQDGQLVTDQIYSDDFQLAQFGILCGYRLGQFKFGAGPNMKYVLFQNSAPQLSEMFELRSQDFRFGAQVILAYRIHKFVQLDVIYDTSFYSATSGYRYDSRIVEVGRNPKAIKFGLSLYFS